MIILYRNQVLPFQKSDVAREAKSCELGKERLGFVWENTQDNLKETQTWYTYSMKTALERETDQWRCSNGEDVKVM